jgi:hypothetical protein
VIEHSECVELALLNSYKTLRYGLHLQFRKCSGGKDSTRAKAKVQENTSQPTWHKVCKSFDNKDWKVNLLKLNRQ